MIMTAIDPKTQQIHSFTDEQSLASAIFNQGYVPLEANKANVPMETQMVSGGYILDGAPLNVWFSGVWYVGQKEVLQPYWNTGAAPVPPASMLNLPVVALPAGVQTAPSIFSQIPPWAWAGLAALLFLR